MHFDEWLLISSVLILLSILAWKVSNRLGIPALLLFLGIGMLAGSDGPGGIYFDNAFVAQSVGVVALAFILFAGGLDTQWKIVRPALGPALALSTLGVLLTAVVVAVFALFLFHVSFLEGLLLGALISATDAAAVFSVLGARNLKLSGKLLPLLELEFEGQCVVGVCHLPALGETAWGGKGLGAWWQPAGGEVRPARVSDVGDPTQLTGASSNTNW